MSQVSPGLTTWSVLHSRDLYSTDRRSQCFLRSDIKAKYFSTPKPIKVFPIQFRGLAHLTIQVQLRLTALLSHRNNTSHRQHNVWQLPIPFFKAELREIFFVHIITTPASDSGHYDFNEELRQATTPNRHTLILKKCLQNQRFPINPYSPWQ